MKAIDNQRSFVVLAILIGLLASCKTSSQIDSRAATQRPMHQFNAMDMSIGAVALLSGDVEVKMIPSTQSTDPGASDAVKVVYNVPDIGAVHVLFGPIPPDTNFTGTIKENGDFVITSGFAYMWVPGNASTRPFIRAPRVNASGRGTAWIVEVRRDDDRTYLPQGSTVEFENSAHVSLGAKITAQGNFVTCNDAGTFSSQRNYQNGDTAEAFTKYVDSFKAASGMPVIYASSTP